MTRGQIIALTAGVVGVGGYLGYAYHKCWFPFSMTERCKAAPPPPPGPPNPPGQPTVQVTVTGPNTVEAVVSWGAVSGAAYYKVYVDGNVAADNVRGTSVKLTNLVPGQTYQIAVAACN